MKFQLHEATFTPYEVEVPDECPNCGKDLTQPFALQVWDWIAQLCDLDEGGGVDPTGSSNWDATYCDSVRCAGCHHEFTERVVEPPKPQPSARKGCDHKFLGSNRCAKCGWSPG